MNRDLRFPWVQAYLNITPPRALKLRPSSVATVFLDEHHNTISVPDPRDYSPAQRAEILEQIRKRVKSFG